MPAHGFHVLVALCGHVCLRLDVAESYLRLSSMVVGKKSSRTHRVGGEAEAEGYRVGVKPLEAVRIELQGNLAPHIRCVHVLPAARRQRAALPQH